MRRAHQAPLPAGAGGRQACRQQGFQEALIAGLQAAGQAV